MRLQIFFLASLGSAAFIPERPSLESRQTAACNGRQPQCCDSIAKASSPQASTLLGLLGVPVDPDSEVGLTCKAPHPSGLSLNPSPLTHPTFWL